MNYYITAHFFTLVSLMVDFFALLAMGSGFQYLFMILSSTAGILCSVSLLCFGLVLLRKKGLGRFLVVIMYLLPAICLTIALLSEQSLILEQGSGIQKPGLLYKLNSGVEYLFRFASCVLLASSVAQKIRKSRFEILMVVVALVSFTLKFVNSLHQPVYLAVIGPLLVLTLFSLLFFGSARLGMFNTMSLGVKRSLELYSEAVFIMDNKGNQVYLNPVCARLNQDTFQAVFHACCSKAQHFREPIQEERILEVEHNRGLYTISMRPTKTLLQYKPGLICVIHDDTVLKATINNLREKNEELVRMNTSIKMLRDQIGHLATIEERNSLAKEIHDVMGHSLNLALHTLESNRLILDDEPEKAIRRLRQVVSDIDSGMDEIAAQTELNHARENQSPPLCSLLAEMADRLAEVGVKLEVLRSNRGEELTDELVKTIYRICQEATTNAIKHGKADQITISIKKRKGVWHIYIIDNGKGCKQITKGNGLRGMEERTESLGGVVCSNSFEDGNGFMVHASIPLETNPPCNG